MSDVAHAEHGADRVGQVVQYRVVFAKKDELVEGPDGAALVVEIAAADAALDPGVAFMQGKLRATGDTGLLFERLKSGEVASALGRLVLSRGA